MHFCNQWGKLHNVLQNVIIKWQFGYFNSMVYIFDIDIYNIDIFTLYVIKVSSSLEVFVLHAYWTQFNAQTHTRTTEQTHHNAHSKADAHTHKHMRAQTHTVVMCNLWFISENSRVRLVNQETWNKKRSKKDDILELVQHIFEGVIVYISHCTYM